MATRGIGLFPQLGLDDEERNHRPALRCLGERAMIDCTQIALEPDDA